MEPKLEYLCNILVVEDEDWLRSAIVAYLKSQGIHPMAAATMQEAMHALDKDGIDLVVLNLKLIGNDGLKILKHIRESPDLAQLPVLVVSAWDMEPTFYNYLEPGDYLIKPFDMRMLNLMIQQLLQFSKVSSPDDGKETSTVKVSHEA